MEQPHPREKSPGHSLTNGPTGTATTPKPRLSLKASLGYLFFKIY